MGRRPYDPGPKNGAIVRRLSLLSVRRRGREEALELGEPVGESLPVYLGTFPQILPRHLNPDDEASRGDPQGYPVIQPLFLKANPLHSPVYVTSLT